MAEAIAFNVVASILFKMGDAAFCEICSVYRVDDDMKKLQETLNTINAALLDADRRQEESHLMKDWIRKLNDVVYDADDVLDAFDTKNLQRQLNMDGRAKMKVSEFFSSSSSLIFRSKLSRKIKKIRERLDEIAKNMSMFNFVLTEGVILDRARVGGSHRETISYVPESYVIGREKEKEEIIDMLICSSSEENVSMVSIVGMGGLGKTALAQSVYCDKRVVSHFELMIWVCVSEDFEKKSLVKRILKSITNREVGDLDMEQLQRILRENIDGRRYLLILDDIWNEDRERWLGVEKLLMGGAQGSKILATTRNFKVTLVMGVETPYILKGLTEEDSWALFEKFAFRGQKEVHAYMESVGKEIIKRCKGVPLAIRSLASVMQSKTTESEWENMQNSDFWPAVENNNSILAIKKIREGLDEIAKNMSMFNFVLTERVIDRPRVGGSHRETFSYVPESYVIGREKEKEGIIGMLMCSSSEENVSMVSIVGMGGLGKTALAESVYCDKRVVGHFELMIWVCVSEDFEKKSLVKRILKSITNCEVGDLDMEQLQRKLRENIDGRRYLLILDDIWNEDRERWLGVENLLMGGAQGSKILATTRNFKVTLVMGVETPYILKGLTEEDSWALFEKFAFRGQKEVHAYMESVGKEIIKRCKGVPLAIRSLASVMQSKTTESEWENMRNSDFWPAVENNNSILAILKLSYDHLPFHLRQCFVYCSIFPKGHKFEKDLLVQLWMAQGYILSSSGSQSLEDIGDRYFEDLISRSFLQDVKVTSDTVFCKMNDLIHDLAVRVAGPRYCSIAENNSAVIFERVNHVLFGDLENVPEQLIQVKGLRTYFSTNEFVYSWSPQLPSKISLLRVLGLSRCGIEKLPNLVGKMQHLRFLDLSMNEKMEVLPNSITNLVNLQTLNLSYCIGLKELPEGISKLISLRHLIINECDKINRMPRGLGKLTSLRTLSKFIVDDNKRSAKLGELNGLNNLRGKLSIENLEKVRNSGLECKEANLMGKPYLTSLSLYWSRGDFDKEDAEILLEGLQPHPNLMKLEIEGYCGVRFPSWIISLPNIVKITFERCSSIQQLPPFYQLPCLKTLILFDLPEVEYDDGSSSSFSTSLTHLRIINCPKLTSMPSPPFLAKLYLDSVSQKLLCQLLTTTTIPSFSPLSRLTSLSILNMEDIEFLPFFPEGVPQNLSSLKKLSIQRCPRLLHLAVSGEIQHLTALEDLQIGDCKELDLTDDGMNWQGLRSLRKIEIKNIPKLACLPEGLTTLKDLQIRECKELDLTHDGMNWQGLRSIHFENIPKLVSLPVGVPQNLTSLKKLSIQRCPRLLHLAASGEIQHLTALEYLEIGKCKELDLTHDGMNWKGLRSLRNIQIREIPKLVSLPDGLQHITTQRVEIRDCPGLIYLPEWTKNIPYFMNSR